MNSVVTQRFILCHDTLLARNAVRSSRQFALSLDYLPQSLSEIMKGRRDATVELLRKAIEVYGINASFLFTGDGEMFSADQPINRGGQKILTVVTDNNQEEKIVHVPLPAQAGYGGQIADPLYFSELQAYSLPDFAGNRGTFRSFTVSGDSMEPTLFQGDKIVCRFIEKDNWIHGLRNDYVYVVVTQNDLLVKRIKNRIQDNETILLVSDNSYYSPKEMHVNEVLEIWMLKLKISPFMHSPSNMRNSFGEEVDQLKDIVSNQSQMIKNLNLTIEKMLKQNRSRI